MAVPCDKAVETGEPLEDALAEFLGGVLGAQVLADGKV